MGCSQGALQPPPTMSHSLDSRLPFTQAEVDQIKSFWESVKRKFEETAREMLIRLFRLYPFFQQLFPALRSLKGEQDMRVSPQFDIHAMAVFSVFDDVIENMDTDLDDVMYKLEDIARVHARIDGFNSDFFQYMEEPFVEAITEKLWGQVSSEDEELMRRLFAWLNECLSTEVIAIEYKLIPGD